MLDRALNFSNIVLKSQKCVVNSRSECDISTIIAGKKISCPLICSNMPAVLSQDICKLFDGAGWFHIYHRIGGLDDIENYIIRANEEKWNFVSISIGIKPEYGNFLYDVKDNGFELNSICIDVAHSWSDQAEKMIKLVRTLWPGAYLIVGNGDNPRWIEWLINLGVDCAKINIGVSRSCRTRQYTGFSSTTVSDLWECYKASNCNIDIISDGGLTVDENNEVWIGDISKAIRFGANFVMSGALFKSCLDNPAIKKGYFGNASREAKGDNHVEGAQLEVKTNLLTMKEMMKLIEESLKSSVSYGGGRSLYDIKNVDFQVI